MDNNVSEASHPETPAVTILRKAGVEFTDHHYTYEEGGGTEVCARELSIDEHSLVKTIVLDADGKPLIVLMHGDMRASAKELARIAGVKAITPCPAQKAEEYTGYEVGGISPFGTRNELPVYMEETILNLRKIYINGGKRGYLVGMDPYDTVKILRPTLVKVGSSRAA
jgi:Cys-tRNA(Pro) deacylase